MSWSVTNFYNAEDYESHILWTTEGLIIHFETFSVTDRRCEYFLHENLTLKTAPHLSHMRHIKHRESLTEIEDLITVNFK